MLTTNQLLGGFDANGQSVFVEMDESYFFHRKYHRGQRRIGLNLYKKLWHEKPDIAGSLLLMGIGWLGLANAWRKYDRDTFHKHRWTYTVIREEDANPTYKEKGSYN
ncbi:unnamed protein product [Lymnaea stagnalis]|uniref:Uncharacterized protein n=1 Tax=Lymnaea stagnalis TaxID=6523 RepID=A0AAV2GY12_LYMST